ncbi:restriction endonuclease [Pontibacillus halophilus]|uniref:restriction endonuclease n=1 Tax=Pontibacillus halophilus TaxID=516704 RepID=UPI001F208553|nr:restriction endonuclease [Pontibacillus halophilus]
MAKSKKDTMDPWSALALFVFISLTMVFGSITMALIGLVIAWIIFMFILSAKKKRYQKKLRLSGIGDIDKMDGNEFERYLAELFKAQGYNVKVTPGSGDYGADLLLKGEEGIIAIQAKRYSKPVGISAVQELAAAKAYYSAKAGWVVTNSRYTKPAMNLAVPNTIRLIEREELINMIVDLKKIEAKK